MCFFFGGVTPNSHPKMIIFSRNNPWLLGGFFLLGGEGIVVGGGLGGETSCFFLFSPLFGEDEPNLTNIFFNGVESTNQLLVVVVGSWCVFCLISMVFGWGRTRIPLHTMTCLYAYILIHLLAITGKENDKNGSFWKGFWSLRFPGTHPFSMERLRMAMVMELKYITEEVIGQPNHSLTMERSCLLGCWFHHLLHVPPKKADPRCKQLQT